jgi:capsular polysaccharide biosynthesis protein
LSYSSLLIGYILFKKENYFPTSFNDIIEKIYKIITIIVIIFIIISIYLEFLLSTPEKEAE